jgi:hypothetical protein
MRGEIHHEHGCRVLQPRNKLGRGRNVLDFTTVEHFPCSRVITCAPDLS